jgi:hypothetical protein
MGYFDSTTSNFFTNGRVYIMNNGTVDQPSLSWPEPTDGDSGFYHPGDGIIKGSINGVERFTMCNDGIRVNGAVTADNDFFWGGFGVPVPGLRNYIPIAWLANGNIVDKAIHCSWPMCYTGASSYINLPNGFSQANDGVQIGPRVRVQLYDIIDPTTQIPTFDLTNLSYTSWSFEATSPANTIRSYRVFFF